MNNSNNLQVSLKNITKRYSNHKILNNINLDIYKGDFICIYGASGTGKSTLLNIIGALEDFNSGEYKCFYKVNPVRNKRDSELLRREKISYLFQNFALVEKMTVMENMRLATKYVKVRKKEEIIISALNELGVLDKLDAKVYELSGGEQQRVAMARNIVKPYDILLADEPTGSLDRKNKNIVIDKLVELNEKGKTIVVVSHDADFKKIAKRNYLIEDGVLKKYEAVM